MSETSRRSSEPLRRHKRLVAGAVLGVAALVGVGVAESTNNAPQLPQSTQSKLHQLEAAKQQHYTQLAEGHGNATKEISPSQGQTSLGVFCTGKEISFTLLNNGQPVGKGTSDCEGVNAVTFPESVGHIPANAIRVSSTDPNESWIILGGPAPVISETASN